MDIFGRDGTRRPAILLVRLIRRHPVVRELVALVVTLVVGTGCRQEMYDQPRYDPYEASTFFADGTGNRPLVEGTVASSPPPGLKPYAATVRTDWDKPVESTHLYEGLVDGELAKTFPFPIAENDLLRGQQRYVIYCSPCHGETGDGQGMIVRRGFPPPPPFYGKLPSADYSQAQRVYDDLREAPVGHFFNVITNGHGVMYSYKSRIAPEDRWRVIAYVRALQLSQYADVDELDEADRQKLSELMSVDPDASKEVQE